MTIDAKTNKYFGMVQLQFWSGEHSMYREHGGGLCAEHGLQYTKQFMYFFVCTILGAYNIITAYISRNTFHSEI